MKKLITLLFIILSHYIYSQNLIRNGDFEENLKDKNYQAHSLYTDTSISKFTKNWNSLFAFTYYINYKLSFDNLLPSIERTRYVKPFRNNAYINVLNTYWYSIGKDSLATKCPFTHTQVYCRMYGGIYQDLASPLKIDSSYVVAYRFKIGDSNRIQGLERETPVNILSNFGVRFSTYRDTYKHETPDSIPHRAELQDTVLDTSYKWRLIERSFKADSTYTSVAFTQFSIQNLKYKLYFVDTNSTTGIPNVYGVDFETYIDDIRLLPLWQYLKVSNDTNICSGNNVSLRVVNGSGPYKWRLASQQSSILSTASSLNIKVDTTSMFQVMSPYDTASIMVYITKPIYDSISITSCGRYLWRGKWRSTSGVYKDTAISTGVCKSFYTLNFNLTLNNKISKLDSTELKADQDSVSYQWYMCNPWTKLNSETKRTIKVSKSKTYAVVLNNGKGCIDTSECVSIGGSSIQSLDKQAWKLFPNPFKEAFSVELDKIYNSISIKLFDITGKLIQSECFKKLSSFNIQNSSLPRGSYFLQIETESASKFYNLKKE